MNYVFRRRDALTNSPQQRNSPKKRRCEERWIFFVKITVFSIPLWIFKKFFPKLYLLNSGTSITKVPLSAGHPKTFHPRFILDLSRVHSGSELGFQIQSGFCLVQTGFGAPLIDVLDFLSFIFTDKNVRSKGQLLEIKLRPIWGWDRKLRPMPKVGLNFRALSF